MKKQKTLDGLIQCIEAILSEGRCSLTDEDKVLLQNCLAELKISPKDFSDIQVRLENVAKWLLAFLEFGAKVKDLF